MSLKSEQPQAMNMSEALRGIWRRKTLVVSSLALGLLAGLTIMMVVKPSFQSEAQVIVENLATPYDKANAQGQDSQHELVNDRMVASQVSVLKSQDLAAHVVDSLKLSEKKEFNPLLSNTGLFSRISIALGFTDDPQLMTPAQLAIIRMGSKLTVYPVPESNVIGIKYQSSNSQVAADVANAIADTYVNSTRETAAGSTGRAREWLSQQIVDLRGKVSISEAAVEKYRSEAGLLKGQTVTLGEQQISELNSQITLADAASSEATARANEIKSLLAAKGSVDASSDVLNSVVVQNLREQQVTASRKISELSATYLPNHPKMIAAQQELNSINVHVRLEALKVIDSLSGQAKVANARAASLRASLEAMKGRESDANQSDVKLKELERDAAANRTLLETMLSRYADANARQDLSLQPGFARVIQKAAPQSSASFPKFGPIMLLCSLAGLLLGFGLAFLMEVMSSAARVSPKNEAKRVHPACAVLDSDFVIPQMPVTWTAPGPQPTTASPFDPVPMTASLSVQRTFAPIAAMPIAPSLASALTLIESTYGDQPSELTAAANQLAASCLELREKQGIKTFSFTSIGSRGNESILAAIATARAIATVKLKIVVLDVTGGSSFDSIFDLPQGPGLSDLVLGDADFKKVICRDPHSSAHVIRYGLKSTAQSQVAILERMNSIITALASIYDFILVHSGEASPSTPALLKDCGAAILLAPAIRQKDAEAAARVLETKGIRNALYVRLDEAVQHMGRQAASA